MQLYKTDCAKQGMPKHKTPLRFASAEDIARAFLRSEKRKVDKSGCISFKGKKYEVGLGYIGRMVEIAYDPADISTVSVEDRDMGTSFRINELSIGAYAGVRPKLPDSMLDIKPETSRLLDGKQKLYEKRKLPQTRAISYSQINKSMEGDGENV